MQKGEGKGWAKGRTAAADARIARSAAAHRGRTYTRHLSPEQDRRHRYGSARTLPLEWSPTMAYVVGLMATDGCLINTGRHLSFGSEDRQLVEVFLTCLGRPVRYQELTTKAGSPYFRCQFGDVRLYRWLEDVGLMQRKSLRLAELAVPDREFTHLARGLLDGDGSILNYTYAGGGRATGRRYEAMVTRFFSSSESHIEWLRSSLTRLLGVAGSINRPEPDEPGWQLNYGIRESVVLLPMLYPAGGVPKLERKWRIWSSYAARHGHAATSTERDGASSIAR